MNICALCNEAVNSVVCCTLGCKRWFCLKCWGSLVDNDKCFECQDKDE